MAQPPGPGYEYFDHTADVGIVARGESLAEALAHAGRGLVALLVDPTSVRPNETRDVLLATDGLEDLLVAWLNEVIFLFDSEHFVPVAYAFSSASGEGLRARLWGETFDPQRHRARGGVKAATYHQASVEGGDGYVLRAIIDV